MPRTRSEKTLDSAILAAKAARTICDGVPILSAFKPITVTAVTICETAQTVQSNEEEILWLSDYTAKVVKTIVEGVKNFSPYVPPEEDDILTLKQTLDDISAYVAKFQTRSRRGFTYRCRSWFRAVRDQDRITGLKDRLQHAMRLFILERTISNSLVLAEVHSASSATESFTSTRRKIHRNHVHSMNIIQGTGYSGSGKVVAIKFFISKSVDLSTRESVSLLTRQYPSEEAYNEAVLRFEKVWNPNVLQIYGVSDGLVVHFRGHPDSLVLSKYFENAFWPFHDAGAIASKIVGWCMTVMGIVEFLGPSVDWGTMLGHESLNSTDRLDWFVVQAGQPVLVDWIPLGEGKVPVTWEKVIPTFGRMMMDGIVRRVVTSRVQFDLREFEAAIEGGSVSRRKT